jgi:tRNA U55 pseudouridine synthase TruB
MTRNDLERYLLPMDLAIPQFDAVYLNQTETRAILNGQFIAAPQNLTTLLARAYDEQHRLIAILERVSERQLKPKKVLTE